jgi:hypothetical protein
MRVVVDRIEGDRVVVEVDGAPAEIARAEAPPAAVEGSTWEVDAWPPSGDWRPVAGDDEARRLLEALRAKTPQRGDIDL